jgi:hypothetical protein
MAEPAPTTTVAHVYGVVAAGPDVPLPGAGIDGAPVRLVRCDNVAAVVSDLDAERYGPEVWTEHREDPAWLGEVASAHNAVLEAVVEHADVLPLRLPALYRSTDEVERTLREDSAKLSAALAEIRGHVELGGKIYLLDQRGPEVGAQPTSGRDYLMRKASEAHRKEEASRQRQRLVLDAHEALALASTHAVVNAPQDRALTGRDEPMLLNAAYLVPREARADFLALADRVADQLFTAGMVLEVSGPWPAYNFASRADNPQTGIAP